MRDIDCKKYNECLTEAAKINRNMDCNKCKHPGVRKAQQIITPQNPSPDIKKQILHNYAVKLGHLGGLKGGPARAKALPKEERVRIARKAAMTRWGTLLDCPFCHKSNLGFEQDLIELGDYAVICLNEECGVVGPFCKNRDEAIKKWNGLMGTG